MQLTGQPESLMTAHTPRHNNSTYRSTRKHPMRSAWLVTLLWLLLAVSWCPRLSHAKEVEATVDWTKLEENDTIAAGMHVRIDMTTGEKFVKLPDDDSNDDDSGEPADGSQKYSRAIQVTSDGTQIPVDAEETHSNLAETTTYDFEMMWRTLSKLPENEREDLQLPDLPDGKLDLLSDEDRLNFERNMKLIWETRQTQLLELEVADLPKILKDCIAELRQYLEDPLAHLKDIDDTALSRDVLGVLQDLEYQLRDIDMARDFFTLGGWPVLASLLSDDVHHMNVWNSDDDKLKSTNTSDAMFDASSLDGNIHAIQAYSAFALGTAVKNVEEFRSMATLPIQLHLEDDTKETSTALDLILKQFSTILDQPVISDALEKKLTKVAYCLGSFLRSNRRAQIHFGSSGGPIILSEALLQINERLDPFAIKMKIKLMNLVADVVQDVTASRSEGVETTSSDEGSQIEKAILASFSSPKWCSAILLALERCGPRDSEQALNAVFAISNECKSDWDRSQVVHAIERVKIAWGEASMDPEIYRELIDLAEGTRKKVLTQE